jgi:hypothetical protein
LMLDNPAATVMVAFGIALYWGEDWRTVSASSIVRIIPNTF